jgi:xanthine/uracil permease
LAVHLLIAPVLMERYGLQGLNLSSLISASLNFLILICGFGFLIHLFIWKTYLLKTMQVMASSAAMAAVMIGLLQILPKESNTLSWILQIVVVGGLGIATYFLSSLFVGHPETRFILDKLIKKIRKS